MAVIGSGIAGLSAAWRLSQKHEVVLFEKEQRVGGHTHTVGVPDGPAVDTGFIVYNERNYPQLTKLFRHFGVETGPSPMSFGVSIGSGAYEYAGDSDVWRMFAQRRNWLSFRHHRLWLEILRLNREVRAALKVDALPDLTLGAYLDRGGYGAELRGRYLLPMCGAIWSCSTRAALDFPFPSFARFFDAHGLLSVRGGPQWRHVRNGSRHYADRLLAEFERRGERRLGTAVNAVRRTDTAAWISTGPSRDEERYDAVICATHTDQTLQLLSDADAAERSVLSAIRYAENEAVLHTDETLMPRRRHAWCAWNYLAEADRIGDAPVSVSYWMNRLQAIAGPVNYIVTLNPFREPAAGMVIDRTRYAHPVFTRDAVVAQQRLPTIQGRRHVWFCGAWTGYGFHEDGLRSGLAVAAAFDCPAPWVAQEGSIPAPTVPFPERVPEADPA
ncbi:MAG: FAD-dependent oxidoreductase [Nevskiales bacterium]|nr:FAD-dependent oxidoreductase [Nevskiales bacterium]